MGTRSDGGGFWWDQSAIKFMLPQVMKQVTYNLLHEFLSTTLCSTGSVNNVEKVEKVHIHIYYMYTYMYVCMYVMYSVLHNMVYMYVYVCVCTK